MSTVLWKEFRENVKWSVLILLIVGVGACYTILPWSWSPYWQQIPIMGGRYGAVNGFLLLTIVGSSTAGLALGLLQGLSERRHDQWAFLVHRPVSWTTLFLGKALAGVCLYLLALGIPLVFAVIWVATPGNMAAPFYGSMAYPALADVLCGLVYYFTGMVMATREARWFGSRGLVLGLPISCSILAVDIPYFWLALLVILFGVAISATAAWGTFVSRGNHSSQPILGRAIVGTGLLAGILMVGMLVIGITVSTFSTRRIPHSQYELAKDGQVIRVTRSGSRITSITDVDGNPITKYDLDRLNRRASAFYDQTLYTSDLLARPDWFLANGSVHYRASHSILLSFQSYGQTQWHYSLPDRLLLAYDNEEKDQVGGVGPDGYFDADSWPQRRFDGDIVALAEMNDLMSLAFSDGVFWFNLYQGEITRVAMPPDDEVVAAAVLQPPRDRQSEPQFAFVSGDRLRIVELDGQGVFDIKLDRAGPQFRQWRVGVAPEGTGYFVWYVPTDEVGRVFTSPSYMTALDSAGNVLGRQDVPPLLRAPSPPTWMETAAGGVVPLGPAAVVVAARTYYERDLDLLAMGVGFYIAALLALVSALVCFLAAIGIARRYAFSRGRATTWGVIGFLFGPAGLLLLWCLLDLPARQPCSSCGKPRVVNRVSCEHCLASFPAPALDGTEIFA